MEVDPHLATRKDFLAADGTVHRGTAVGALVCDHTNGACLYKGVGDIAAIGCKVPEVVAVHGFAGDLAGEANFIA